MQDLSINLPIRISTPYSKSSPPPPKKIISQTVHSVRWYNFLTLPTFTSSPFEDKESQCLCASVSYRDNPHGLFIMD